MRKNATTRERQGKRVTKGMNDKRREKRRKKKKKKRERRVKDRQEREKDRAKCYERNERQEKRRKEKLKRRKKGENEKKIENLLQIFIQFEAFIVHAPYFPREKVEYEHHSRFRHESKLTAVF